MRKSFTLVMGLIIASTFSGPAASLKLEPLPRIRVAADGRGFETAARRPFVAFGVTYYRPGTGWAPQVWKQFDAESTRRDFARMKEMGVNCARVFLTYGSFFMETNRVSPEALQKFDQFLDIAEQAGIYVHPTGPDHWEGLPDWAKKDRYADDLVLSSLEEFWRQLAARYRGRSAIFAYDLLNEPEIGWDSTSIRTKWNHWLHEKYTTAAAVAAAWGPTNAPEAFGQIPVPTKDSCANCPRLLDFQLFREHLADEWTRRQAAAIKSADPQALVTVGMIQWSVPVILGGPAQYSGFRPKRQTRFLDFLEVHFYPLARGFYQYAPADEERNLAYVESVVREAALAGKPVILAEFGWYGGGQPTFGKHPVASQEQQARWCRKVVETTAGFTCGWLNWGFYDHPQARDVSQLTGLMTADGTPKAWGKEFQQLTRKFGERKLPPPTVKRPVLDWDLAITSTAGAARFLEDYQEARRRKER